MLCAAGNGYVQSKTEQSTKKKKKRGETVKPLSIPCYRFLIQILLMDAGFSFIIFFPWIFPLWLGIPDLFL